ncbi:hypothetical protein MTR_5g070380 [Medicago truncatula]|uniref:Uncharacterized protein n=1 Tax=Medicago truncatula TaxID=3880 RepID=G7KE53_MEDTR|nr:hypothetical protein MTR_5g070380 [Medicago truncatula]
MTRWFLKTGQFNTSTHFSHRPNYTSELSGLIRFSYAVRSMIHWKTLISDPTFVKLHLQQSSRKRHIAEIRYEASYNAVTFPLSHLLEKPALTLASNSYYQLECRERGRFVGSCNGLLCLLSYSYTSNHNRDETIFWFQIWNPATRIISKKSFVPKVKQAIGNRTMWCFSKDYVESLAWIC